MGILRIALALLVLAWAGPAPAQVDRWSVYIAEASARFGVPPDWIRRVMAAESGGRTMLNGRPIRSSAGALGLMQLMPGTWADMRARHGLGADPHDPRDNILAGTAYLRLMLEQFGYPGLFAAYNAGPARFATHLATGRRLPAETVAYVAQVAGMPGARPPAPPATGLTAQITRPFFVDLTGHRRFAPDSGRAPSPDPREASLFVHLDQAVRREE